MCRPVERSFHSVLAGKLRSDRGRRTGATGFGTRLEIDVMPFCPCGRIGRRNNDDKLTTFAKPHREQLPFVLCQHRFRLGCGFAACAKTLSILGESLMAPRTSGHKLFLTEFAEVHFQRSGVRDGGPTASLSHFRPETILALDSPISFEAQEKRAIETLHVSKHRLGHSLVGNLISHHKRL